MTKDIKKWEEWQKKVLKEQKLRGWKVKNTGKGDGLCIYKSKTIICTLDVYALFLHEVAHALTPQKKRDGHTSIWADVFTALCELYLVSQE